MLRAAHVLPQGAQIGGTYLAYKLKLPPCSQQWLPVHKIREGSKVEIAKKLANDP
jgi:hypothetical protein